MIPAARQSYNNLVISGTGSLTKTGTGTLTISGVQQTYNGGTFVNGGTLVLGHTAITAFTTGVLLNNSNLTISNNAVVSLYTTNATYPNTIYDSIGGAVTIQSGGVLSADGTVAASNTNNLYDLVLQGGTLRGTTTASPSYGHFSIDHSVTASGDQQSVISANISTGLASYAIPFNVSGSGGLLVSGVVQNGTVIPYVLGINKQGTGTLTLSVGESYTGTTTVTGGLLDVTGKLGGAGYTGASAYASILVQSAGTAFTGNDPTISREVGGSSGVAYTDLGSTIVGSSFTTPTYAQIVAGTAGGAYNVAMSWRNPTAAELLGGAGAIPLVSDVINIAGIGGGDTYSLMMCYDATALGARAPSLGEWESGVWTPLAGTVSGNTVTALVTGPGEFAVIPEPGTLVLLATGLLGLLAYAWRKRK